MEAYYFAIGAVAGIHESASVLVSPAGSGDLDSGSRSITISPSFENGCSVVYENMRAWMIIVIEYYEENMQSS